MTNAVHTRNIPKDEAHPAIITMRLYNDQVVSIIEALKFQAMELAQYERKQPEDMIDWKLAELITKEFLA